VKPRLSGRVFEKKIDRARIDNKKVNRFIIVLAVALTLSVHCRLSAEPNSISSTLETTCKPCDDFFKHVNQRWLESNPIPASQSRWGRMSSLAEGNREKLKVILDGVSADLEAGKLAVGTPQRKMAEMYASCMDTAAIEKLGLQPLEADLKLVDQIQDQASLQRAMVRWSNLGVYAPLFMSASPDLKNAQEIILQIGNGGLSLPEREFYFRKDARSVGIRDAFLKHVAAMHRLAGDSPEGAESAAKTILELETKFAEATMTNVERRNPDNRYHRMDLAKLKESAPGFDWESLLKSADIAPSTPINLIEPKFYARFNQLLTEAPLSTWKTYLRWRMLTATASYLPERFEKEDFEFSKTLTGVKEQRPRWQRCVIQTDRTFGDTLGQEFVKKYFPPEAKRRMDQLVDNMKSTLADELKTAEWLSAPTRQQALLKLNKITPKIGYPTKWKDYAAVTTSKTTLIDNLRSNRAFELKRNLNKIGKPIDRTDWGMTPPTVNAYYSPTMNEIAFPAGILQPPMFDVTADDAMNYGAIGAVIGHEIGHGFDDQGSKFDADGNLRNWWTDEDRAKFEARAGCIIDQFNGFDVQPGARHNGRLVTGEALGDLGGLNLAFKAYQRSLKGKKSKVIDGLTGEQRFFIAFARVWGSQSRPEAERLQLQTDPHPVAKSRANETLANMPEFHQAFQCKLGQPMVRAIDKQCKLW
jgi:putative endopeptidase